MKRHFLRIGLVFVCVLAAARVGEACSCGGSGNVLESFEGSKNVVLVTATNVTRAAAGEHAVDGVSSTRMVVDKVYKGKLRVGDEITFAQGGGADCIWTFSGESIGKRYLFYLGEGDKNTRWMAITCGRSNRAELAGEDLRYLDNLAKVRGKTRVSGTVEFEGLGDVGAPSAEGINIKLIGPGGTRRLKTDKNGVYEIYGLAPGIYEVVPEIPRGWKINQFYLGYENDLLGRARDGDDDKKVKDYRVRLDAAGHSSLSFHLEIDNALRGRVLDPSGNPMKGVCVRLYPPTGVTKDFMYNADCTESDGRFVLDEIPPGNYIIVANDENKLSSREPFRTLYYPGVFGLEKATVVSVGIGEHLDGLDITVPVIEELITVEGRFVWSDGSPVVNESVQFFPAIKADDVDGEARAATDQSGRFRLKVLKGIKGRVIGTMYTYIGEFEKCPKLEAFIRSKGRTNADVVSNEISIDADENLVNLELKLPFPGCRKSRE